MKTAKQLLQAYIDGSAQEAASLFAEKGALELPYLADLGVDASEVGEAGSRTTVLALGSPPARGRTRAPRSITASSAIVFRAAMLSSANDRASLARGDFSMHQLLPESWDALDDLAAACTPGKTRHD